MRRNTHIARNWEPNGKREKGYFAIARLGMDWERNRKREKEVMRVRSVENVAAEKQEL